MFSDNSDSSEDDDYTDEEEDDDFVSVNEEFALNVTILFSFIKKKACQASWILSNNKMNLSCSEKSLRNSNKTLYLSPWCSPSLKMIKTCWKKWFTYKKTRNKPGKWFRLKNDLFFVLIIINFYKILMESQASKA